MVFVGGWGCNIQDAVGPSNIAWWSIAMIQFMAFYSKCYALLVRSEIKGMHLATVAYCPGYLKYLLLSPLQGAAANPENEDQQQRLREAAEGLRVATNAAAQNAIKKKIVNRLEVRKGAGF